MLTLSPFVQIIFSPDEDTAMVFHSLFGNPTILNKEGLEFLRLFNKPVSGDEIISCCEGDPSSLIEEFTSSHFLVEPGFDEREYLRSQQDSHLRLVANRQTIDRMGLAISDACNFACRHCIHSQSGCGTGANSSGPLLMTWDTAKNCVDVYLNEMRRRGQSFGKIHFGNAEPLLNWKVIERVLNYCIKQSDIEFHFAINTNLNCLTKPIAETLKYYGVLIATSLDGAKEANDAIRRTKSGSSTFESIVAKFDLLASIDYSLDGFSITVTSDNFDLVDESVIDIAIERKMVNLAFDYDLIGLVGVSVQDRVEKLMRLKRYSNKHGIAFYGTWDSVFRNLTQGDLSVGRQFFCAAVEGRSLEFNVDGTIKVCGHTNTVIGDVGKIDDLFGPEGGLTRFVTMRLPGVDPNCWGCPFEGPCGGQCHVTREVATKTLESASLLKDVCSFYQMVTKALAYEYMRSPDALSCRLVDCSTYP